MVAELAAQVARDPREPRRWPRSITTTINRKKMTIRSREATVACLELSDMINLKDRAAPERVQSLSSAASEIYCPAHPIKML